mmetsp:Transcript_8898/g.13443  ORF Transcript_8898/g.13443 Transcript_8898/m.13443 type:complete len:84 (-) Transcript_8898:55-306(-)
MRIDMKAQQTLVSLTICFRVAAPVCNTIAIANCFSITLGTKTMSRSKSFVTRIIGGRNAAFICGSVCFKASSAICVACLTKAA